MGNFPHKNAIVDTNISKAISTFQDHLTENHHAVILNIVVDTTTCIGNTISTL
jgi:hypothetical protein